MNQESTFQVTCQKGHVLRAPQKAIGMSLPCPVCRVIVTISNPLTDELSGSPVIRTVGDRVRGTRSEQPTANQTAVKVELSDTGIMRILDGGNPSVASVASLASFDMPKLRSCPVCSSGVPEASSVCKHCNSYVGSAPDYLNSLKR